MPELHINHICEKCHIRVAVHRHHKFSQTKHNRRTYPEYIDHPDNLVHLCYKCHEIDEPERWAEPEFCTHFGIAIRSKSGIKLFPHN